MDYFVAILGIVIGLSICFFGIWYFFFMLPIWGFLGGFLLGAAATTALFGDGFLATGLGIVIGLVVGIIGAIISYFYWYVAVLMAAGVAGWAVGLALFGTLGVDTDWLLFLIGLISAIVFILGALFINYPIYLIVANTALGGAVIAIAGMLLVFNEIERIELGTGEVWNRIQDNWWLWIVWLVLSLAGIFVQLRKMDEVNLPEKRWTKVQALSVGPVPS